MSDKIEFFDKSGRSVTPGDLIVYTIKFGSSPTLTYCKVLKIVRGERNPNQVKVKAFSVNKRWNRLRMNEKPSLLEMSDRMLIVTRSQVPEDVLQELDKISPQCNCEVTSPHIGHELSCCRVQE